MGAFYDRYGRAAYTIILRIVNDPSAAEDVLAETFIKAWNRLGGLKEDARIELNLWILNLARNNAFEYLRSTRGWLGNSLPKLGALENLSLFQDVARNRDPAQWRILQNAFSSLSGHERQVMELACFDGLSPAEMSIRLEQSPPEIKNWITSALAKLSAAR
ncbi:MAG TPA: sigma-70 family RNA polymerase sigma factor [Bryobacteraceae bacterium]